MDFVDNNDGGSSSCSSMKAKITAHPHYPRLLAAYVNCQKVGAPPATVARLDEAYAAAAAAMSCNGGGSGCAGEDPTLDQFMEAYCEMLTKYEQELSKPFEEAVFFLQTIERQLRALTVDSPINFGVTTGADFLSVPPSQYPPEANVVTCFGGIKMDCEDLMMRSNGLYPPLLGILRGSDVEEICSRVITSCNENTESSEDEMDVENSRSMVDPQADDRELKDRLLRKYRGCLGSLKQEFMKKRKKGKLPKEARQQLLGWWNGHYKWPYPSESQKLALAESTGLDQKQINNWFINQRKRHWKPSEDMQFVVVDPVHPHHYFMDNFLSSPYPLDFSHIMH